MKCPSCNKFATYSTDQEPEVELESTGNEDGVEVHGTVHIVLLSECCGDELKESEFELSEEIDAEVIRTEIGKVLAENLSRDLTPDELELIAAMDLSTIEWNEPDVDDCYIEENRQATIQKTLKNGTVKTIQIKPRYQKTFYGYYLSGNVVGNVKLDGHELEISMPFDAKDEIQASSMDEMV